MSVNFSEPFEWFLSGAIGRTSCLGTVKMLKCFPLEVFCRHVWRHGDAEANINI